MAVIKAKVIDRFTILDAAGVNELRPYLRNASAQSFILGSACRAPLTSNYVGSKKIGVGGFGKRTQL